MEARTVTTDRELFEQDFRFGWAMVRQHGYPGRGPNGLDATDRAAVAIRAGISAAKKRAGGITQPQPETIQRAFDRWVRACRKAEDR